jgi:putative transposase
VLPQKAEHIRHVPAAIADQAFGCAPWSFAVTIIDEDEAGRRSMPNYRRAHAPGAMYFFTIVTNRRAPILVSDLARRCLRSAFLGARARWPFEITAVVLLPDHLHAIWSLPRGDAEYPRRWSWIKHDFTLKWLQGGGAEKAVSRAQQRARRRGIWQRRYWEHLIRDEQDEALRLHSLQPRETWPRSLSSRLGIFELSSVRPIG